MGKPNPSVVHYGSAMPPLPCQASMLLADPPKWTDQWTAYGTVALAAVTVATLVATLWLAHRDRKDAAARLAEEQARARTDRAEAEQRLREEREEGDRRIREEREAVENRQLRERQIANAAALLHRIADLQPYLANVPVLASLNSRPRVSPEFADREALDAIIRLRHGAQAEAYALHNPRAAGLYRAYVQLVVAAKVGAWAEQLRDVEQSDRNELLRTLAKRISGDLRRFSLYVQLWLEALIEGREIPEDVLGPFASTGSPSLPVLGRPPADRSLWNPQSVPPLWFEHLQLDPEDPQFRPLP